MQLSIGGVAGTLFPCLFSYSLKKKKRSTNLSGKGAVLKDPKTGNFIFENRCSMNLCGVPSTLSFSADRCACFSWVYSELGCESGITSPLC